MFNMKKATTLALCAAMLLSAATLFACGEKDPANTNGADSGQDASSVSTSDSADQTEPEHVDKFTPLEQKFEGEFNLLVSGKAGDCNVEFKDFSALEAGYEKTQLEEAVYRKNAAVEELYGIKLNVIEDMGGSNQAYQKLLTAATAGSDDYDAAIIAAYDAIPLATADALYELGSIEALNLNNSWWDQRANTELTIHGAIFFTTGDITVWDDMQQNVVGFNKQVKADHNIEDDFYQVVADGEWTLEALATYAKQVTEDLNQDGVYNMSDKFGIITWDDSTYAVFGGAGEKVVTVGNDGELSLTLTGSERIVDVMTTYTNICFGGDAINYQRYTSVEAINMFSSNRALFFLGRPQSLDNYRDMETDYGILPYPKYNADQEEYYTTPSPYHMTFACVPMMTGDPEKSGAVLEALAYYGKEYMTGAYYDTTLTGQYFRDEDSVATLELMAETRSYDIGFYIQPANINKELIFLFRKGSTDFVSTFDSYKSAAQTALAEVNEKYKEAADVWAQ